MGDFQAMNNTPTMTNIPFNTTTLDGQLLLQVNHFRNFLLITNFLNNLTGFLEYPFTFFHKMVNKREFLKIFGLYRLQAMDSL